MFCYMVLYYLMLYLGPSLCESDWQLQTNIRIGFYHVWYDISDGELIIAT